MSAHIFVYDEAIGLKKDSKEAAESSGSEWMYFKMMLGCLILILSFILIISAFKLNCLRKGFPKKFQRTILSSDTALSMRSQLIEVSRRSCDSYIVIPLTFLIMALLLKMSYFISVFSGAHNGEVTGNYLEASLFQIWSLASLLAAYLSLAHYLMTL